MITPEQARAHVKRWNGTDRVPDRCGAVVLELADQLDHLLTALLECENALADYIPTIERTGASLNHGHSVLRNVRSLVARYERAAITAITSKE